MTEPFKEGEIRNELGKVKFVNCDNIFRRSQKKIAKLQSFQSSNNLIIVDS